MSKHCKYCYGTGLKHDVAYRLEGDKSIEQQLREKEARIARLEEALSIAASVLNSGYEPTGCEMDFMYEVADEVEQQSLAHIQAEAVEQFVADLESFNTMREANGYEPYTPDEYADQLRQQTDKG